MNPVTRFLRIAVLLLAGLVPAEVFHLHAQGSLTPPGPPAPLMKTLSEVEPRTAVNSTNTPGDTDSVFRISQSGSYYLTGNVTGASGKHGIQIEANGVTFDLNGFTLVGVLGSLDGINMPSSKNNVLIRNGHVRSWGESGIDARINSGRIEKVTAASNIAWGIDNNSAGALLTHIDSCEALDNGVSGSSGGGFRGGNGSLVTNCVAISNRAAGIVVSSEGIVSDCTVLSTEGGPGISAAVGCIIKGNVSSSNQGDGILGGTSSTVVDCAVYLNDGDGIEVGADSLVSGNASDSNGAVSGNGAAIHVTGADNRIENNNCTDSVRGIDVDVAGNIIVRNTCSGNTTNWDIVAGNVCLVVQATPTAGAIIGNSGGTAPGSTDPSANFTY